MRLALVMFFFALTNFLDDERAGLGFYSKVDIKFQG